MTETRGSTAAPESGRPEDAETEFDDTGAVKVGKTSTAPGDKKPAKKSKARKSKKKPSQRRFRPGLFLRQVVAELRKVVWPTRNELTTYTAVVIVFVAIIIAIVSALDFGISKAVIAVFG